MFSEYRTKQAYDELFESTGVPRASVAEFVRTVDELDEALIASRQQAADNCLENLGITFNVYGHQQGTERVWPFDVVPRIIGSDEWQTIESGLKQRITALNLFVHDVYNERRIIQAGIVPESLILSSKTYRKECLGLQPPHGSWCHVTGTDLIRDQDGKVYVLEDNLRCPSGVAYVLTNRDLMKRTFSQVFKGMSVKPVADYAENLLRTLIECSPVSDQPTAVLLTPGIFNSAYFEHTFLAQQMGIELVEGADLIVHDGYVQMKTTRGLQRVDVIYRRIDDDFLDPAEFRSDSALGVRGLMDVYRAGRVNLANAPGTGIADDKAIYAYVPEIIRFYLREEPILKNVPTMLCSDEKQRGHVLQNLDKMVVKPTNESGGYGILIGPMSTQAQREATAAAVRKNPRDWIAQPMLCLSTVPTIIEGVMQPRHVDLRPFILSGKSIYVMPGGLTRVALQEGSMVVNSSQGGGSKDTWVVSRAAGEQSITTGQMQQQAATTIDAGASLQLQTQSQSQPTELSETLSRGMLSRVAESMYWMSRYIERAENVARFFEVNFNLTLDDEALPNQWCPLIDTTGDVDDFNDRYQESSRDNVLRFLLFDRDNPNSVISCVSRARGNARAIRQIVPTVVWEELNKFHLLTKEAGKSFERSTEPDMGEMQLFCEEVRRASHLLEGALASSMSKTESWHFAQLGQMLERADKTSRILDVQYYLLLPRTADIGSTLDIVRWTALLQSTNALAMFRRRFGNITPSRVAEFLILDPHFPRSMHHGLRSAQQALLAICDVHDDLPEPHPASSEALQRINELVATMKQTTIAQIIEKGMHQYVDSFQIEINKIGAAVTEQFFKWHTP